MIKQFSDLPKDNDFNLTKKFIQDSYKSYI